MAAVLLAAALLVGCSSSSGEDSGSADTGGGAGGGGSVAVPGDPGTPEGAPAADAEIDRQVITTSFASVVVEDPAASAQRVSELVESVGGRVEERSEQAASDEDDGERAVADLVVRVPASELTGVLADLEDLGDVRNVSVSRSDVTATAVDLDARISALQTSVARLQSLMDDAASTEALLAAEGALSARQEQLESLQSQRAFLGDQVALSTLSVHLESAEVEAVDESAGFVDGLGAGWDALVWVGSAVVVVLGALLPWIPVALVLAGAALVSVRLTRRRECHRASPPPASPTTGLSRGADRRRRRPRSGTCPLGSEHPGADSLDLPGLMGWGAVEGAPMTTRRTAETRRHRHRHRLRDLAGPRRVDRPAQRRPPSGTSPSGSVRPRTSSGSPAGSSWSCSDWRRSACRARRGRKRTTLH